MLDQRLTEIPTGKHSFSIIDVKKAVKGLGGSNLMVGSLAQEVSGTFVAWESNIDDGHSGAPT